MDYESRIVGLVSSRLEMGRKQYGDFNPHDGRHWVRETLEEVADGLVYIAARLIQLQEVDEMDFVEDSRKKLLFALRDVVLACERARKLEIKEHDPEYEQKTRLTEIDELMRRTRERIELLDGTTSRMRAQDLEWITTRKCWFPSGCDSVDGANCTDFQSKVARFNCEKVGPRSGIVGDESQVPVHVHRRSRASDKADLEDRDKVRAGKIRAYLERTGAKNVSKSRAAEIAKVRDDVVYRLMDYQWSPLELDDCEKVRLKVGVK